MKKIFYSLLCVAILFSFSSCATLFGPSKHDLTLGSNPAGAEVFINGISYGKAPLKLQLSAQKPLVVEFRIPGKQTIVRKVDSKVGIKWVVLDVLGGLLPVIIDAVTGNWYELTEDNVHADFSTGIASPKGEVVVVAPDKK